MPCNCVKTNPVATKTSPRQPCFLCAEKHLSGAAAFAREHGYADVNRAYVVGEIWAAELHLAPSPDPAAQELLAALRDLRHRIQSRREDETLTDFSPYLLAIDAIIRAELASEESES